MAFPILLLKHHPGKIYLNQILESLYKISPQTSYLTNEDHHGTLIGLEPLSIFSVA